MIDISQSAYWIPRVALGILITAAGIGKLLDLPGFVKVIHTYKLGLPRWLAWSVALIVLTFELGLGVVILFGIHLHTAAAWSIVMHTGYFILLTITLLRGIKLKNCGCFGVFLPRPLTWYSPLEDLILIGLSYSLFLTT